MAMALFAPLTLSTSKGGADLFSRELGKWALRPRAGVEQVADPV